MNSHLWVHPSPSRSSKTPSYPQSVVSWGMCPNSILSLFHSRTHYWVLWGVWGCVSVLLSILVMGTIEWPLVQWSIPITTPHPTIEITLTCAYCQQVGHEFKNYPFVDDKLKCLLRERLITFLPHVTTSTRVIHVGVPIPQIRSQLVLVIHPTLISQHLNWYVVICYTTEGKTT